MFKERYYGKFKVSAGFLESSTYWRIFNNIKVIEARFDVMSNMIEYTTWSPWFPSVEIGTLIPEYDMSFDADNNVIVSGVRKEQLNWQ